MLTEKNKLFAIEYLKDLNATKAAERAGYSIKTSYSIGQQLIQKIEVKNFIESELEKLKDKNIAEVEEVLLYLTSVLRGKEKEEVVVTEGQGEGITEARIIEKQVSVKDRLKSAELLGKRLGLFNEKLSIDVVPIIISGEDELIE